MKKIKFNIPYVSHNELLDIKKIFKYQNFISFGYFYKKCINLIKKKLNVKNVFLTNSCTSAIEAALLSINLKKK